MDKSNLVGKPLLDRVRAGFVAQGTSLNAWCTENAVSYPNARQALIGSWNGPKGVAVRQRIVEAAIGADSDA